MCSDQEIFGSSTIHRQKKVPDACCEIRSRLFVYGDSRYSLYIWPRGHKGSDKKEWLGICLYKYDVPGIGDSVEFGIATDLGNINTCTVKCSENNLFRQERFIEWTDFLILKHTLAPNGCLTIVCRLFIENRQRNYKQNRNNSEAFCYPAYNPSVTYQSDDSHLRKPLKRSTSFRITSPETKSTSFIDSGFNYGTPSTINPFFSSALFENAFKYIPESLETNNSDFKMPYTVARATTGNTLRNRYLRGLGIECEKITSSPSSSSTKENPRKTASVSDSAKGYSDTINVSKIPNSSDIASSECGLSITANSCPRSTQSREHFTKAGNDTIGLKTLSQHFKNLYLEGMEFDLKILLEGKEFKVLKAILKARSPVFMEWLLEKAGENTNNIISIDPVDACNSMVFHDFLLYIYSGEIENLSEKNNYGLYCLAEKFQMPELKEECIRQLQNSLSNGIITDNSYQHIAKILNRWILQQPS